MILEGNMKYVGMNHPDLLAHLESGDPGCGDIALSVAESRSGMPVPVVENEGKEIMVHSRFDPEKEAGRFIEEVKALDHDLYIVLGFGFGYHVEALREKIPAAALMVVIEKSAAMMRAALSARDLSGMLSDGRIRILVRPDEETLADVLKGRSSAKVSVIMHRGSFQLDPDFYSNAAELARSYLSTKEVNIATLAKFERIWCSNIAVNTRRFIESPGADIFFGKFSGVPAIVAAAGPSLSHDLEFIRKNCGRALVVCVDTAYRVLLSAGIEPHFCVAADPQVINARYFEGTRPGRTVLIADPTVHPSLFRLFGGMTAFAGVPFKVMDWIGKIAGERGEIAHGGSVSTNAYDFAKKLGARPVIFTGQDLAFTGGRAHAKGSYLDEQLHLRSGRLKTIEMFNRGQLTALPKIFVRGIRSERVHTNQKMMIFLSWFEKREDPDAVNATYDGACIPGMKHCQSGDLALADHGIGLFRAIEDLYAASCAVNASAPGNIFLETASKMLDELDSILPALSRAVGQSEKLFAIIKNGERNRNRYDHILTGLAETDRIIESKLNIKDMISLAMQRVIHTITEGYDIDGGDEYLTEDELVAKRSRYLYKGLLDAAKFNRKILLKMIAIMGS